MTRLILDSHTIIFFGVIYHYLVKKIMDHKLVSGLTLESHPSKGVVSKKMSISSLSINEMKEIKLIKKRER